MSGTEQAMDSNILAKIKEKLFNYFFDNIIKCVFGLGLLIGSIVVIVYLFEIKSLAIDFYNINLLYLIIAFAFISGIMLIYGILIFSIPSLIGIAYTQYLFPENIDKEKNKLNCIKWAFLISYLSFNLSTLLNHLLAIYFYNNYLVLLIIHFSIFSLIILSILNIRFFKNKILFVNEMNNNFLFTQISFVGLLSCILSTLFSFKLFFLNVENSIVRFMITLFVSPALSFCSYHICEAFITEKNLLESLIKSLIITGIFSFIFFTASGLLNKNFHSMFEILGIRVINSKLILDKEHCNYIAQFTHESLLLPTQPTCTKKMNILLALGDTDYVSYHVNGEDYRFTLPKSAIKMIMKEPIKDKI